MEIITLTDRLNFASNCYILISNNNFSVIDPSVSYEAAIAEHPALSDLSPRFILLTHGHLDHIWEIDSYVKRGCKVLVSKEDSEMLSDKFLNCSFMLSGKMTAYNGDFDILAEGNTIDLGGEYLRVIETPGHTEGSVSYLADDAIFTGDTLFAGGAYGRYDLPTGNLTKLKASLDKILSLPADLIVYSGHGEVTRLADTKSFFR